MLQALVESDEEEDIGIQYGDSEDDDDLTIEETIIPAMLPPPPPQTQSAAPPPSLPTPSLPVANVGHPSTSQRRKRRRAISPTPTRVQRPNLMEEDEISEVTLSPEESEMLETEARRGISGEKVIHR